MEPNYSNYSTDELLDTLNVMDEAEHPERAQRLKQEIASRQAREAEKAEPQSDQMEFYVVSLKKFLILFLGTFGFYTVYWFYKHWNMYKHSSNEDMWPVMRAIFSIFFTHSLFALFEMKYTNKTGEPPRSINHLASIYVVFAIGCQICSNMSDNGYGNPVTMYLSLLILPISCYVLYQAQSLANYAGQDVKGQSNSVLTGLNYFWLLIGAVFWVLILFGIYAVNIGIS